MPTFQSNMGTFDYIFYLFKHPDTVVKLIVAICGRIESWRGGEPLTQQSRNNFLRLQFPIEFISKSNMSFTRNREDIY